VDAQGKLGRTASGAAAAQSAAQAEIERTARAAEAAKARLDKARVFNEQVVKVGRQAEMEAASRGAARVAQTREEGPARLQAFREAIKKAREERATVVRATATCLRETEALKRNPTIYAAREKARADEQAASEGVKAAEEAYWKEK
nr:hypothetical protein [Escherichia coli]